MGFSVTTVDAEIPMQLLPGVKRQGREADHSPPFGAEVKNDSEHNS
jgi:hypothetical protein